VPGSREPPFFDGTSPMKAENRLAIKTEWFAGHHEARQALVLSVAGVMAIMLIANLFLLILY
jgi:hypothetical protein